MAECKKIGVIGAMDVEVRALKALLTDCKVTNAFGLEYVEGKLEGVPVVVVKSGIGKVNAALCTQYLVTFFNVTHVINTGIAGAMASGLKVLDFVVSTDAMYHDFDVRGFGYPVCVIPQMDCSDFEADAGLVDAAKAAFAQLPEAQGHALVAGRVASGDQFISSKEQKDEIKERCSPACVEMEGAAIAHACHLLKVPFVVIRCMSDMADENGESTYSFNEETAALLSGKLVQKMISSI